MNSDPDNVLEIASSIGDGGPIEWSVLQSAGKESIDPALIQELEIIARIAQAHRSAADAPAGPPSASDESRWGPLVLKERLGAGTFGTVYRAYDPRLERDVALKLYRSSSSGTDSLQSMFQEGRLLARVRHPNVVVVHGVERHGDEVGLWLEMVDGRTLADEVRGAGPLGFREAALVGQDVCRALAAVHRARLVHRDIKAQNVMRERGGRIVLMDFGLSRATDTVAGGLDVGGTPLYMAPELFAGGRGTPATDIYAVGVLLYFLVTGGFPVFAPNREGLEQNHRDGCRRLLRDARPDLPDGFADVIERACAVDPADRFATPGALLTALARALGMSSDASAERSGRAADKKPSRFSSSWLRYAAMLALVVVVAAGVMIGTRPSPSHPTVEPPVAPVDPDLYRIHAVFQRATASGGQVLAAGGRVDPGDRLFVEMQATRSIHVYIVSQDDRGESYLLFPLQGQRLTNPLPADTTHRLPGRRADGRELYWQVTSAGAREHFLIVASPEPLAALEAVFNKLPKPEADAPVATSTPLSREVMGQLRGIGGLATESLPSPSADLMRSAVALAPGPESIKGPWMRQFTLENPGR